MTGTIRGRALPRILLALLVAAFFLLILWPGKAKAAPLTFTVTNTNDSGAGSLREAITAANSNPGMDTIAFNITTGPFEIQPQPTALPAITSPVLIDGFTQSGSATIAIVLNGSLVSGNGLDFQSGSAGSTVRGLCISNFPGYGININANNVTVAGNYIGTDASGTASLGNANGGVMITGSNNTIGGVTPGDRNVISGNQGEGVCLYSGSDNTVQWNLIGTNAAGTAALGNDSYGVRCGSSTDCDIVGNLIWHNLGPGVLVDGRLRVKRKPELDIRQRRPGHRTDRGRQQGIRFPGVLRVPVHAGRRRRHRHRDRPRRRAGGDLCHRSHSRPEWPRRRPHVSDGRERPAAAAPSVPSCPVSPTVTAFRP